MRPLLRLARVAANVGFVAFALPAAGFFVAAASLSTIERRSDR